VHITEGMAARQHELLIKLGISLLSLFCGFSGLQKVDNNIKTLTLADFLIKQSKSHVFVFLF